MEKNDVKHSAAIVSGMPVKTRQAMQEGRRKHNALMNELDPGKRQAYKLCQSAIATIELVQAKLLRGQPVMPEFLQSIGTLQSYGAGML